MVAANGLRVALGGRTILDGLTFEIPAGSFVGLLGPNGSGKTTLIRTISGVLPYTGHLSLRGRPLRSWPRRALARQVAVVRQAPTLAFDFTVEDIVLLGRAPHKGWLEPFTAADRARVREALAAVDLADAAHRLIHTLSGGEQQRVFLAQALAQEADLLLLDEPTAHLDVHYQFEFLDRVRGLVAEGRTVVAVFHDLSLAARYADRLLVLHRGRLVADGPPAEVLAEALIARVFRMAARIHYLPDGLPCIQYLHPITENATSA
ncbi:ABC transporter ATP-binding protein [Rhodothermus marinus]|uniref:ABC transporter ATP-binding protein n=1 Tax=Rhodothermus marinus TaxID=29549 RepID=UPI0012BA55A6|nr:ABC transporter ATP-binding protein [Rhodothermus marinus]BBM69906.1 hemin ABC transporter ATP-binding protein [Rhodothermus marinus]BBM72892.1 hemin ABC transporter ATP-binding protein [Rhodothermus marinus]